MKKFKLLMINIILLTLINVLPKEKIVDQIQVSVQVTEQVCEQVTISSRSLEEPRIAENIAEERQFYQKATSYSENCINLIKKYEGFRENAYKLDGEKNWTIGYGHSGADVKEGQTITEEDAERLLIAEVQGICDYVLTKVEYLQLNQNELDALVSFTYNCGIGNLNKLTKDRNKEEVAEHITAYTNGGVKGLVNRRNEELKMFLGGVENEETQIEY